MTKEDWASWKELVSSFAYGYLLNAMSRQVHDCGRAADRRRHHVSGLLYATLHFGM